MINLGENEALYAINLERIHEIQNTLNDDGWIAALIEVIMNRVPIKYMYNTSRIINEWDLNLSIFIIMSLTTITFHSGFPLLNTYTVHDNWNRLC